MGDTPTKFVPYSCPNAPLRRKLQRRSRGVRFREPPHYEGCATLSISRLGHIPNIAQLRSVTMWAFEGMHTREPLPRTATTNTKLIVYITAGQLETTREAPWNMQHADISRLTTRLLASFVGIQADYGNHCTQRLREYVCRKVFDLKWSGSCSFRLVSATITRVEINQCAFRLCVGY